MQSQQEVVGLADGMELSETRPGTSIQTSRPVRLQLLRDGESREAGIEMTISDVRRQRTQGQEARGKLGRAISRCLRRRTTHVDGIKDIKAVLG